MMVITDFATYSKRFPNSSSINPSIQVASTIQKEKT